MLETITGKFEQVFRKLSGRSKLTEQNIKEGLREIKLALLEADVNYQVVKDFIKNVEAKAIGEKVLSKVNPVEQFYKIVYDELVKLLGENAEDLKILPKGITIIMLVGLQGSGKTTTAAKLAYFLTRKMNYNGKVLLSSIDVYRPAAQEQLKVLASQINVPYYDLDEKDPVKLAKKAYEYAKSHNLNILILDTAGRLEIDEKMMKELEKVKLVLPVTETLFVSDAMAGQAIVNIIKTFDERLKITGIILTKFDSDTRGGAALSAKFVTGKPIKFIGVGEKIEDIERFYPERLAGRILGRGDILSLVEKVQEVVEEEEARKLEEKFRQAKFDLNDYLKQLLQIKKF